MESAKNVLRKSKKNLPLSDEQLKNLAQNPTVTLSLMTILESPEFELCLHKTLSSFNPGEVRDKTKRWRRTIELRIWEIYGVENKLDDFAVDYILARNKEFKAPAAIRAAVLAIGDQVVQESAKQISERLIIEKEAAEKEKAEKAETPKEETKETPKKKSAPRKKATPKKSNNTPDEIEL